MKIDCTNIIVSVNDVFDVSSHTLEMGLRFADVSRVQELL